MASPVYAYRRQWELRSTPDEIWTFIANTHRLNYYAHSPAVADALPPDQRLPNAHRLLRAAITEFEEAPFNWIKPIRFSTTRKFTRFRVFDELTSAVELEQTPTGGTRVHYAMTATAAHIWMRPFTPLLLRRILNAFDRPLREFDASVQQAPRPPQLAMQPRKAHILPGGRTRFPALIHAFELALKDYSLPMELAARLGDFLSEADAIDLAQIRPHTLALYWGIPRQAAIEACLLATRAGLLRMRWELLCPMCGGQKGYSEDLQYMEMEAHCATCNITFGANFSESVELLFRPDPSFRHTESQDFCVHGPELTPHIMAQQLLAPGETRPLKLALDPGNYRLRAMELTGSQPVRVSEGGNAELRVEITPAGWPPETLVLSPAVTLEIVNQTSQEQLFILERTRWNEHATTGAEVIAMQAFRDLFADEALKVGRQIEVGVQTILFADIRSSTRMYREMGDATAFASVLDYFDILREVVREEGGAIVKTIGDAVMGVFQQPAPALRAILRARDRLRAIEPFIAIKAGLHSGPAIAVNLNGRMDYFGTTINIASRLEALCRPDGFVVSDSIMADPEIAEMLARRREISAHCETIELRGLEGERQTIWHLVGNR